MRRSNHRETMRILSLFLFLTTFAISAAGAKFSAIDTKLAPEVFVWTDTCNVYVVREGDAALLIEDGDDDLDR